MSRHRSLLKHGVLALGLLLAPGMLATAFAQGAAPGPDPMKVALDTVWVLLTAKDRSTSAAAL